MNNTLPADVEASLTPDLWEHIRGNRKIRMATAERSHTWFFSLYLSRYLKHPTADFQKEIFMLTENQEIEYAVIVAFRGSGKSTVVTMSYPIWAVLGSQQKKFILILSQTQQQARLHLANIKREFEANELLRADFGPLEEESDEWGSSSLVLTKYGARISAASTDQSIRGLRHGEHRPDLIICDDVEDMMSTKTQEGRDKTYNWLTGEVLPAGDQNTKVVMVGNLLHEDSLLMRLRASFESGRLNGVFRAYPVVTPSNQILWPGKYPNHDAIETAKRKLGNEKAWQREFMLKIVPEDDQVIFPAWIRYYDELPSQEQDHYRYTAVGIDLAISLRTTADCTAMVSAQVHGNVEDLKIYILPRPVNAHLTHLQTLDEARDLVARLGTKHSVKLYIEDVGYQSALIEQLNRENYSAEGVKVYGQDKRARLTAVSHLVESGRVVFPRQGCEQLIHQLTGFGSERYDDLADAFAILLQRVLENDGVRSTGTVMVGRHSLWAGFSEFENNRWVTLNDNF